MPPMSPWEHLAPIKTLYSACMEPVCRRHGVTRTELDILLFLVNNPQYDTAADIVEVRYLAKSHVSTSLTALEGAGYLERFRVPGDRRTVRLRVLPKAEALAEDGRAAQEQFMGILWAGLSWEELQTVEHCFDQSLRNIKAFLEGKTSC